MIVLCVELGARPGRIDQFQATWTAANVKIAIPGGGYARSCVESYSPNAHRMETYGGCSYQYTANGEMTQKTCGAAVMQFDIDVMGIA
jgi:hypothetical protein